MLSKWRHYVWCISLLLCLATVAVWVRSCWHVNGRGVWWSCIARHDAQVTTWIYNARYWRGDVMFQRRVSSLRFMSSTSAIDLERAWAAYPRFISFYPAEPPPPWHRRPLVDFDLLGIEYVHLPIRAGREVAEDVLSIPLWQPAFVFAACGVVPRWLRRPRAAKGLCPRCGYDLRASPDRCPECGAPAVPRAT